MTLQYPLIFFFFSSRRRHTRWPRDWSSDVCSSDLVSRLAWSKRNTRLMEHFDSVRGGGHVGAFGHGNNAVGHQGARGIGVQLILSGAGQGHIAGNTPDIAAFHVLGVFMLVGVFFDALALYFFQALDGIQMDAIF